MKPRGIQRAVRPQRFDRSAGDAPSLGRVARVPGTGQPKGQRRKKRRGESGRGDRERGKRKLVMVTWSVVLGGIALGALGVAVWLGMRSSMKQDSSAIGVSSVEREMERRVESQFKSPSEDAALALVTRAVSIRDSAEVAEVFHLGHASADEAVDFLSKMEAVDGRVDGFTWLSSMDANGLLIDGVLVKTILDGEVRNRLALLTPDDQGEWKIDFGAFARAVEPPWSELLEQNAAEGIVRVIVAADTYYNGPFRDDRQWVCYGMASPDTEVVMLGYCRKDSPQAKAMERIVSDENAFPVGRSGAHPPKRVTLDVRRVEGGGTRQFEISRVIAEDWVMSATPFDENFK